jgi:hypothetical protein
MIRRCFPFLYQQSDLSNARDRIRVLEEEKRRESAILKAKNAQLKMQMAEGLRAIGTGLQALKQDLRVEKQDLSVEKQDLSVEKDNPSELVMLKAQNAQLMADLRAIAGELQTLKHDVDSEKNMPYVERLCTTSELHSEASPSKALNRSGDWSSVGRRLDYRDGVEGSPSKRGLRNSDGVNRAIKSGINALKTRGSDAQTGLLNRFEMIAKSAENQRKIAELGGIEEIVWRWNNGWEAEKEAAGRVLVNLAENSDNKEKIIELNAGAVLNPKNIFSIKKGPFTSQQFHEVALVALNRFRANELARTGDGTGAFDLNKPTDPPLKEPVGAAGDAVSVGCFEDAESTLNRDVKEIVNWLVDAVVDNSG